MTLGHEKLDVYRLSINYVDVKLNWITSLKCLASWVEEVIVFKKLNLMGKQNSILISIESKPNKQIQRSYAR